MVDNNSGKEIIPPVYEKLGWSTGNFKLIGDLIGYREEGKWGLITVNNKRVSGPDYYQLSILDENHILAAIKGTFTNQLFHGLIDADGRKKINCHYFDIKKIDNAFLVVSYDGYNFKKGIFNSNYQQIIPPEFLSIEKASSYLWAVRDFKFKWHFYDLQGSKIFDQPADSYDLSDGAIVITSFGKKGLITAKGKLVHSISYKDVSLTGKKEFPAWEILNKDLTPVDSGIRADSLDIFGDLFLTYANGTQSVLLNTEKLYDTKNIEIKDARAGYLVAREKQTGHWSLKTTAGKVIADQKDSILFDGIYFYSLKESEWEIFNRFGRKLSPKKFESVRLSVNNLVPVGKNGFWGLMDFQGELINGIKFDSIGEGNGRLVAVNYLGEWGAIDGFGSWEIKPSFDEIFFFNDLIFARKGALWNVFDSDYHLINKVTYALDRTDDLIRVKSKDGNVGAISDRGYVVASPIYKKVSKLGSNFLAYMDDYVVMLNSQGEFLIPADEKVQQIDQYSEDYYRIKKDGSYGFVDTLGRLRIANRYNGAGAFKDDRAPVKLNGKWGYVDHREVLVIQPFYDFASTFENGLAIVAIKDKYGLINVDGKEVIEPKFSKIEHKSGYGYLLITHDQKMGVADKDGNINLRPRYDQIELATDELLIVKYQENTGIMNTSGYTKVPLEYDEIKLLGDYFLLRKDPNSP